MNNTRLVFTPERAAEFWSEIQQLLERFPETLGGLVRCYSDLDPLDVDDADRITLHGPFDEDSPVYHQSMIFASTIRNMQGYETMFLVSPPDQSSYVTDGIIANAFQQI